MSGSARAASGEGADRATPGTSGAEALARAREELRGVARACAAGDEGAFAVLQRRLGPALSRVFVDRGAHHDLAEDLTQRTMLGLWQALTSGRYEPDRAAITTFAYAVAGKVWLQHLRASGRADAALDRYTRLVRMGEATTGTDPDGRRAALLQAVRDVVSDRAREGANGEGVLTEEERWLVGSWALGESDRTLAKKLGIAPSNVNMRKQRAYAKLRAFLVRSGHADDDEGGTRP